MGQSCRADDVNILQKAITQSSDPRVHYPEERSKAKVVDNYQCISVLKSRLKQFFRTEYFRQ